MLAECHKDFTAYLCTFVWFHISDTIAKTIRGTSTVEFTSCASLYISFLPTVLHYFDVYDSVFIRAPAGQRLSGNFFCNLQCMLVLTSSISSTLSMLCYRPFFLKFDIQRRPFLFLISKESWHAEVFG